MLSHRSINAIAGSQQGDQHLQSGINPSLRAFNSRMGYFLWLNASIITTNVAKVIANINDSNTDIGTTPFRTGVSRPPLSYLFYYPAIIPYIRSWNSDFYWFIT